MKICSAQGEGFNSSGNEQTKPSMMLIGSNAQGRGGQGETKKRPPKMVHVAPKAAQDAEWRVPPLDSIPSYTIEFV